MFSGRVRSRGALAYVRMALSLPELGIAKDSWGSSAHVWPFPTYPDLSTYLDRRLRMEILQASNYYLGSWSPRVKS